MTADIETVPVLLGWRCPRCGDAFPTPRALRGHHRAMHHAGLLAHEISRPTVDVPRRCAFGADLGPLALP